MIIELVFAMAFLAVAIGALLTVFVSSHLSLRHASIEGNALALAEKQMEALKTLPLAGVKLNAATIPAGDPYATSPPTNLTSSQVSRVPAGQVTGGTVSATQAVTGPDGRSYRVDSYVFQETPTNGRALLEVTVAVRRVVSGTPSGIKAYTTSAIDLASTQRAPD
jgi:type II secretory pathway pseudopilin PulG